MMDYKDILVFIDKDENDSLSEISKELIGKAREMADELNERVITVSIGDNVERFAKDSIYYGADMGVYVNNELLRDYSTVPFAKVFNEIIDKYTPHAILLPSNTNGRDLGGRICAKRKIGLVADCSDVKLNDDKSEVMWIRPTFDGRLYSNITIKTFPKIGTVSSGVFKVPERDESREGIVQKEDIKVTSEDILSVIKEFIEDVKEDECLENCSIVVSGGMGLGSKENWYIVEDLAKALHAQVGATKPCCDNGWVPAEIQVGSTGVRVAPKLYIAVGISGAIQHIAGIKKSDIIVAINNDKDAPIFKNANYGIVGDLFEIVPKLTKKIKELNK